MELSKRQQIESIPTTLSEKEYVFAIRNILKKWRVQSNEKKKQRCRENQKKRLNEIETFINNQFILSGQQWLKKQPYGLTSEEVVNAFFKTLCKKHKFQKMQWVSVPSCDITYECEMGEFCNSMITEGKYISGGYFNILTKDYVCKTCWGNAFLHDYYSEVNVNICSIFPSMKETFAQQIYDLAH